MATFEISTEDALKISLSAHAYMLLRAVLGKLIDFLLPLLSGYSYKFRTLYRVHESAPDLLPRMLSQQASLLVLTILTLVALSHTSVSLIPFGHQLHPTPDFLIRVVLCACTARHMLMASWLLLGNEVTLKRTGTEVKLTSTTTTGESGSRVWDFLYFVICGGTTLVSLGYHQNFLLAMTLPFQELSSIFRGYAKLSKIMSALKASRFAIPDTQTRSMSISREAKCLTFVSCLICLICKAVLPMLILALALQRESPLVMDQLPLMWFFWSCAFLSIFHLALIYLEIVRITGRGKRNEFIMGVKRKFWGLELFERLEKLCRNKKIRKGHEGTGSKLALQSRDRSNSIDLQSHPESLTNDIYQDTAFGKQNINKYHIGKLRDLNFGLLRPYDNRNISFCTGEPDSRETSERDESPESSHPNKALAVDKINIVRDKDTTKTWLIYRLLANSLSSPKPHSTSPMSSTLPSEAIASEGDGHDISEIQPWVFPVLCDAITNTKLQYQAFAMEATQNSPGDSHSVTYDDKFPLYSDESQFLEDSKKSLRSADSYHNYGGKETSDKSRLVISENQENRSLPSSSSIKNDIYTPNGDLMSEQLTFSRDAASADVKYSTYTIKSTVQLRHGHRGVHKLSSDCVQLLSGSKESLQGSCAELGKEFSDV
ncbi:hypothetical protein ElyMa_004459700 [Elysia marginata]|uniref:Gustatory receptor n=1 Tax=Elysia marginata TaxID=1093978 RepID=A0AAV4HGJ3_9GAST|nr:hypothetical protein ElyMa_004459700 [Elysia marginata]